jgi:hypothetical protein
MAGKFRYCPSKLASPSTSRRPLLLEIPISMATLIFRFVRRNRGSIPARVICQVSEARRSATASVPLDPCQEHGRVYHNGQLSGFLTVLEDFPDDHFTIIAMGNTDDSISLRSCIRLRDSIDRRWRSPTPPHPTKPPAGTFTGRHSTGFSSM